MPSTSAVRGHRAKQAGVRSHKAARAGGGARTRTVKSGNCTTALPTAAYLGTWAAGLLAHPRLDDTLGSQSLWVAASQCWRGGRGGAAAEPEAAAGRTPNSNAHKASQNTRAQACKRTHTRQLHWGIASGPFSTRPPPPLTPLKPLKDAKQGHPGEYVARLPHTADPHARTRHKAQLPGP
jgi:hypothetical protein